MIDLAIFPFVGCDITLSPGQSACCGSETALHCDYGGGLGVDECINDSTCEVFSSVSIHDCRCDYS